MYKKLKIKIIAIVVILFITLIAFVACQEDNNAEPVTLNNIKNSLTDAGYTIIENTDPLPENSIGGFSFVFPGAHGNTNTPVLEFQDNAAAEAYAEIVNMSDDFLAIVK